MACMIHPVIADGQRAAMSVHELLFFTDEPGAHAAAFRDYQRARMIEARNADAAAAIERRKSHNIAAFFREAAGSVASMQAY